MFLDKLLFNSHYAIKLTKKLLNLLNVNVSNISLSKDLEEHPDFPSLLSISDILNSYRVENVSLRLTPSIEKLQGLPTPFIVEMSDSEMHKGYLSIIKSTSNNQVIYYEIQNEKWQKLNQDLFVKRWRGIVLLAEASIEAGEKEFTNNTQIERRGIATTYLSVFLIPLIVFGVCISALLNVGHIALFPIIFLFITMMGVAIGILLIWYEIDKSNSALQQICSAGKNVNCSAVLQSKGSRIAGISWSAIGLLYFSGGLLSLIIGGITNQTVLYILSWLNVFVLPYVFFSIYYQWKIVKQWCMLCLIVQGLLVLQFIITFTNSWHSIIRPFDIDISSFERIIISFLLSIFIINIILPILTKNQEAKQNVIVLQRLKNNPQILEALLERQKNITNEPIGLGLQLGNPNAKNKLIKVCNPYCGPCAKAHPAIEELLQHNKDLQVQIIFSIPDADNELSPPVRHLLAIAETGDEIYLKNALDDWYNAPIKDYDKFAAKYKMTGDLSMQGHKLDAMYEWCKKNETHHTPMFFINGHELPEMYTVNDLKHFMLSAH